MPDTSTKITVLADYNTLSTNGMRQFMRVMRHDYPDVEFKSYIRRGGDVEAILNAIVVVAQSPLSWVLVTRAIVSTVDKALDVIRKGVSVYREIKGEIPGVSSTLRIESREGGPVIQCNIDDLTEGDFHLQGLIETLQNHPSDDIKRANCIMVARDDVGDWRIRHYSGENDLWRDFE